MSTDASKIACGAVLEQEHDGIRLPIAYASRKFTKGESNKATIEQELTAIHWAITYFKPYLYGRRFTVSTDHKPLVYLYSLKDPSSKLARMRLDLRDFSFGIDYVKGKDNVGADALSRVIINSEDLENLENIYAMTRSRTKNENVQGKPLNQNSKSDQLRVYDSITNIDVYNIPKLVFTLKQDCLEIEIRTKNLKGELALARVFPAKGMVQIKECIQQINKMAKNMNMKKLALSNSDVLFNNISREDFKEACKFLKDVAIILYNPAKVLKNKDEINKLIQESHNSPTGGHLGITKMINKLRRIYHWKDMKKTITEFVNKCKTCKENKHRPMTKEEYELTSTSTKAFETVSIDTIGPITKSTKGNRYALTAQCDLTKYIIVIPIPDKQAISLARAFVENICLVFGCPSIIKTDMGTEYKNEIFIEVCKLLKINHKTSTAYHPQTIGALERSHRCLNKFLRQFINDQHDDWDSWLPFFAFSYNTAPHTEHQYTPFELIFGTQPTFPTNFKTLAKPEPIYNHDAYYKELKYRLQLAAIKARELLEKNKAIRKTKQKIKKPIDITINSEVWLKKENRRKLDPVYSGPFKVIDIKHPNVKIKDKITNETQLVHKNRLTQ